MNLKPIHTDDDYEAALQEIDRLWDAQPGTEESDQLEIWATLVEAYEAGRYELPPPDPIQAIEYYLESRGLSRRDLEPHIGSRGRVSEILNRKRPLTIAMIRSLEQATGIPASVLIQPYALEKETPKSTVSRISTTQTSVAGLIAAD